MGNDGKVPLHYIKENFDDQRLINTLIYRFLIANIIRTFHQIHSWDAFADNSTAGIEVCCNPTNIWHKGEIPGFLFLSRAHRKYTYRKWQQADKTGRSTESFLKSRFNYWKAHLLDEILQLQFSKNDSNLIIFLFHNPHAVAVAKIAQLTKSWR